MFGINNNKAEQNMNVRPSLDDAIVSEKGDYWISFFFTYDLILTVPGNGYSSYEEIYKDISSSPEVKLISDSGMDAIAFRAHGLSQVLDTVKETRWNQDIVNSILVPGETVTFTMVAEYSDEEIEILDETLTYRELLENNGIELEESTIVVDSISRYDEDYEIFVKDDSLDDLAQ